MDDPHHDESIDRFHGIDGVTAGDRDPGRRADGLPAFDDPPDHVDRQLVHRPHGKKIFRAGEQMVVHALAEGVLMEDLIQFCRCDYMAVLRFP